MNPAASESPTSSPMPHKSPGIIGNTIRYVVPTALSNIAVFLFSIIDGIFVGRGVGPDALGAVNLVMPAIMLLYAAITLINIGGATLCAVSIGRNDIAAANQVFFHSLVLAAAIGTATCLAGVLFTGPICDLLGANSLFRPLMIDYLRWYSAFTIPTALFVVLSSFGRNDGKPGLVSTATIVATLTNIFLDWLFIFPLEMGLKGAAIATGLSETLGFALVALSFAARTGSLRFHLHAPSLALIKKMLLRGTPEALNQLAAPISTMCLNLVLLSYIGAIGVNSFAIMAYIASFAVAAFAGVSQGMQPLFGQTFGKGNIAELHRYFRAGLTISGVGSVLVFLALLLAGHPICSLFVAEARTVDYTVAHLPAFASGFVIMALNVTMTAYLYSTERPKAAIAINVLRSIAVNIAVIAVAPMLFGAEAIWYALTAYEGIVFVIAVFVVRHAERKLYEDARGQA